MWSGNSSFSYSTAPNSEIPPTGNPQGTNPSNSRNHETPSNADTHNKDGKQQHIQGRAPIAIGHISQRIVVSPSAHAPKAAPGETGGEMMSGRTAQGSKRPPPPPLDTMRAYRACLNCRGRKSKCDLDINQGRPVRLVSIPSPTLSYAITLVGSLTRPLVLFSNCAYHISQEFPALPAYDVILYLSSLHRRYYSALLTI